MPAVQIPRLKAQVAELCRLFTRPVEFRKDLRDLLEFYANKAYRSSELVQAVSVFQDYRVPRLIMMHLEQSLGLLCVNNPAAALQLADELWIDSYWEIRYLGVYVLGHTPLAPPDVSERTAGEETVLRLLRWAKPDESTPVLDLLFTQATFLLRREMPVIWLGIIEKWLADSDTAYTRVGLRALLSLACDPEFKNLPAIFRLMGVLIQKKEYQVTPDFTMILEELINHTPVESAYFIRQLLINNPSDPHIIRMVRRFLPLFSQSSQDSLKVLL